jgi:hypothetical protein
VTLLPFTSAGGYRIYLVKESIEALHPSVDPVNISTTIYCGGRPVGVKESIEVVRGMIEAK